MMNNDYRVELLLRCASMSDGETDYKGECPSCKQVGSFSLTKTFEGCLFNCFRASCGFRGAIGGTHHHAPSTIDNGNTLEKTEYYHAPETVLLPKHIEKYFRMKFKFTSPIDGKYVRWNPEFEEVVFMLYNKWQAKIGHQSRFYSDLSDLPPPRAKALTKFMPNVEHKQCYVVDYECAHKYSDRPTMVVVEDMWSALKTAKYYPTICLLGSYLSYKDALNSPAKNLIIMLDPDAEAAAHKMHKNLLPYFNKIKTIVPPADPKDLCESILTELFRDSAQYLS